MRRCARLTCWTAFGRTDRSWCSFVWLYTSGTRLAGEFRRFDVEWLKRPRRIRCRLDPSRRKPESKLANSASHQDEIEYEHRGQQVGTLLLPRGRINPSANLSAIEYETGMPMMMRNAGVIHTSLPAHCRARRRNKRMPSRIKSTLGNQTSSSGWACGFPRNVSPMITNRKYVVATIKPMANPMEVSRRCAVTPSGTPMIANATHANGNEKRLLISVRLALRSRLFSLFNCSSNCAIDNAERLGRFFCFS